MQEREINNSICNNSCSKKDFDEKYCTNQELSLSEGSCCFSQFKHERSVSEKYSRKRSKLSIESVKSECVSEDLKLHKSSEEGNYSTCNNLCPEKEFKEKCRNNQDISPSEGSCCLSQSQHEVNELVRCSVKRLKLSIESFSSSSGCTSEDLKLHKSIDTGNYSIFDEKLCNNQVVFSLSDGSCCFPRVKMKEQSEEDTS